MYSKADLQWNTNSTVLTHKCSTISNYYLPKDFKPWTGGDLCLLTLAHIDICLKYNIQRGTVHLGYCSLSFVYVVSQEVFCTKCQRCLNVCFKFHKCTSALNKGHDCEKKAAQKQTDLSESPAHSILTLTLMYFIHTHS